MTVSASAHCSIFDDDTIQPHEVVDETLVAEAGRLLAGAALDAQVIPFGSHAHEESSPSC
jgi:hypothetical protein